MKRGTPDHRKMKDLSKRLKIPLPYAVGLMEMLWHFVAKWNPQGDVGRVPDEYIAEACGWKGNPQKFINALVECGWLDRDPDYRLLVHDWDQHADQSVSKTLKNRKLDFIRPTQDHKVYFLQSKATGLIKIGTTRRKVADRVAEIQISLAERVEVIGAVSGSYQLETRIQEMFTDLKERGEWFRPESKLIDYIELICMNSAIILESDRKEYPALAFAFPEPLPEPLRQPEPPKKPVLVSATNPEPEIPVPADVVSLAELESAWDEHRNYRNGESLDHAVRIIASMDKFDLGKFRERHRQYCEYWAREGWTKYGVLTFIGWLQAGMPLPPIRAEPGRKKFAQIIPALEPELPVGYFAEIEDSLSGKKSLDN